MPSTPHHPDSILRKEAIGFFTIIVLSWATEILHLPQLLFSEPSPFNWYRPLLRTVVVLAIWLWVHVATKQLLKRLHHLEEFLLICSWCRKVGHDGDWLTLEEYFGSKFATQTTHGICPECAKKACGHPGSQPPIPMTEGPDSRHNSAS
jgi:hypothetical protein